MSAAPSSSGPFACVATRLVLLAVLAIGLIFGAALVRSMIAATPATAGVVAEPVSMSLTVEGQTDGPLDLYIGDTYDFTLSFTGLDADGIIDLMVRSSPDDPFGFYIAIVNGATSPYSGQFTVRESWEDVATQYLIVTAYAAADGYSVEHVSNAIPVNIGVDPDNTAPTAAPQSLTIVEDEPVEISLTGSDDEDDVLTYKIVNGPVDGSLDTLDGDTVTYTPDENANGTDTFTFTVSDGKLASEPATVDLSIDAINDVPLAVDDAFSVAQDTPTSFAAPGVLGNDIDADGDALTAIDLVNPNPDEVTVVLGMDGSIEITTAPAAEGPYTVTYVAEDSSGTVSEPATVMILVIGYAAPTITGVDLAPTISGRNQYFDDFVLDDDVTRPDQLRVTVTGQANGVASAYYRYFQPLPEAYIGELAYLPNAGFVGTETLTLTVSDGERSTVLTVVITVTEEISVTLTLDAPSSGGGPIELVAGETYGFSVSYTGISTENELGLTMRYRQSRPDGFLAMQDSNVPSPYTGEFYVEDYWAEEGTLYLTASIYDGSLFGDEYVSNSIRVIVVEEAPNATPSASPQSVTTDEDVPVEIILFGTDPNDDDLTYAVVDGPANGSLSVLDIDTLTYTPDPEFFGDDSFTFTVSDGIDTSEPATVDLTVTSVNDPPIAGDDELEPVRSEETRTILASELLANDSAGPDNENQTLTITGVQISSGGTVVLNGDGNVEFTPTPSTGGTAIFDYTVSDGQDTDDATVQFSIDGVPIAEDDEFTGSPQDEERLFTADELLVNDSAGTGDQDQVLSIISVTAGTGGTIVTSGDGPTVSFITFTPTPDFVGLATFDYTISDGVQTDSATVSFEITEVVVNQPPVAAADAYTVPDGRATTIPASGVLANDTDPDGDAADLVVVEVDVPDGINVTIAEDGGVVMTPGAPGVFEITYIVQDGGGAQSLPGTVTITVERSVPPTANAQDLTTNEDEVLPITLSATDPYGEPFDFAITSDPTHGTLSALDGATLTYTPEAGYSGPDSFMFTATSAELTSEPAMVTITVMPVNHAPVARDDAYTVFDDRATTIEIPGVLANDSDPDGDEIFSNEHSLSTPEGLDATFDRNGLIQINPTLGVYTFTYRAVDSQGARSEPATVTITVIPNAAPTIADLAATGTVISGQTYTDLFTVADAETAAADLAVSVVIGRVTGSADGSAAITGTGANRTVTLATTAGTVGTIQFDVSVSDGVKTVTELVTVTLQLPNRPPVASPQSVTTNEDTPVEINLTGSDADGDDLTYDVVSGPNNGLLTGTAPALTYAPVAGSSGPDSFTFTVSDGESTSGPATVSITIAPVDDLPVAFPQSVTTNEDIPVTITFEYEDSDSTSEDITFAIADGPTSGSISAITGNTVVYSPDADFAGVDSFTFTVSDGTATSEPVTIDITVNPVNDPPVASPQTVSTAEDIPLAITLAGTDPEMGSLTYTVADGPASGSLSGTGPSLTYTPDANFVGVDSFAFTVSDGDLTSLPATVSVTVTRVDDAPVASPQAVTTDEDTAVEITLTGTDLDTPADELLFAIVDDPTSGTLSLIDGDTVTYTPADDASGLDSFTFTVSDGTTTSELATVSITVTPANDAPVILSGSVPGNRTVPTTGPSGAVVSFPVPTATDVDGDPVTVTCAPPTGSLFPVGTTTVTCTATDNMGATDTANFTVTVTATLGRVGWIGGPQSGATYTTATLPAAPTCEGVGFAFPVTQCRVYGYETAPGRYTLTARARDTQGNTVIATRTYTVVAGSPATATPRPTTAPTRPATSVPTTNPTLTPTRTVRTPVPTSPPTSPPTAVPTATPASTPPPAVTPAPTRPPRR